MNSVRFANTYTESGDQNSLIQLVQEQETRNARVRVRERTGADRSGLERTGDTADKGRLCIPSVNDGISHRAGHRTVKLCENSIG